MGWLRNPCCRIPNVIHSLSQQTKQLENNDLFHSRVFNYLTPRRESEHKPFPVNKPILPLNLVPKGLSTPPVAHMCPGNVSWRKGSFDNNWQEHCRGAGLLPLAQGSSHQTLLSCKLIYFQDLEQCNNCIKDMLVGCRCCSTDYYLNFCVSRCPVGTVATHCVGI